MNISLILPIFKVYCRFAGWADVYFRKVGEVPADLLRAVPEWNLERNSRLGNITEVMEPGMLRPTDLLTKRSSYKMGASPNAARSDTPDFISG